MPYLPCVAPQDMTKGKHNMNLAGEYPEVSQHGHWWAELRLSSLRRGLRSDDIIFDFFEEVVRICLAEHTAFYHFFDMLFRSS